MGKPTNIEVYAPPLLLSLMGENKSKPDPQSFGMYRNQVRDGYGALCNGGSFNHQQILHAVNLWDRGAPAADWWRGYFRQQLGQEKPQEGEELMGFFGGSEPFGPSYEPFRWGSALAVRRWALQNHDDDLVQLTGRYAEVVSTLSALGAVPFPDKVVYWNEKNKRMRYTGPYVSPVGERSNQHAASDLCQLFASSLGWEYQYLPAPDWSLAIALMPGSDLGVGGEVATALRDYVQGQPGPLDPLAKVLEGITMRTEQHFVRWPEGRLVFKPQRTNGNTPCYLYDWLPYEEQTATLVYPWPPGRGQNVQGAGRCWIDGEHKISVQTIYGDLCPEPFALPAGEPISVVTMGPEGLLTGRKLADVMGEPPAEPMEQGGGDDSEAEN
jgi:hypothetical protein